MPLSRESTRTKTEEKRGARPVVPQPDSRLDLVPFPNSRMLVLTRSMLGKLITSRKPILAWLFLAALVGFLTFVTWAWK